MKRSSRAALLALLTAALPALSARAAAQEAEAWVLPRGLLEVGATGAYAGWDPRLDGQPLGADLFGPYQGLVNRLLTGRAEPVAAGLQDLFTTLPDPDSTSEPVTATTGTLSL